MDAFVTHRGKVAVMDWSDVNTDLIIPARYLKRVERTGYGPLLFADKRYEPNGSPSAEDPTQHGKPAEDFPINKPEYLGATILIVGKNFGCGSSREHAVWAVAQAGFRVVIAPGIGEGFADIFEGNSFNNGLLPIELPDADWQAVVDSMRGGGEITVDLQNQSITTHPPSEESRAFTFEVPEENRQRLLKGLDFIAETLLEDAAIRNYEQSAPPWAAAVQTSEAVS